MRSDGIFLGLDPRWSVARVVDSPVPSPGTVAFQLAAGIAALSCLGIPAAEEWAAPIEAVDQSLNSGGGPRPRRGAPTSSSGSPRKTGRASRSWGSLGLEDDETLRNLMVTFKPHILHFFCHGRSLVAPTSNWPPRPTGSRRRRCPPVPGT